MTKRAIILITVSAVCVVGAVIGLLIGLLGGSEVDKIKLKSNNLLLHYGDTVEIGTLIKGEDYEVEVLEPKIVSIFDDMLVATECGETNVKFIGKNNSVVLPIRVYAHTIAFDTTSLSLYTNGENTANVNVLVCGVPYNGNITYTYDEEIISYENAVVTALSEGSTTLTASVLGTTSVLTATCEITVKRYGYVDTIDDTPITMLVNHSVPFDVVSYESGDEVAPILTYDSEYISIEDGVLSAHKVGTTEIEVEACEGLNNNNIYTIIVSIEEVLNIESVALKCGLESTDTIKAGKKSDDTYTVYTLEITYNKPVLAIPQISGVAVVDTRNEGDICYVDFTKSDLSEISIEISDIDNAIKTYDCTFGMSEYLQEIEYTLSYPSGSELVNKLYLYNSTYKIEAETDGKYNVANLSVASDIYVSTTSNLSFAGGVVSGISAGTGKITLLATDGSGLKIDIPIEVEVVKATHIGVFIPFNMEINEIFDINITSITPIYAITDIEYVYDPEYFGKTGEQYVAFKVGSSTITVRDNVSKIEEKRTITISDTLVDIIYDNQAVEVISLNMGNQTFIEIESLYTTLKYKINGNDVDTQSILDIMTPPDTMLFITALQVGEITLLFYDETKLIAKVKIIVS